MRKPKDPYDLDFRRLRNKYMEDTTVKLKFSKASFVHYCKNPYPYDEAYGGGDTIITMELVQAPKGLKYTRLEDPDHVKKQQKQMAKEQAKQELLAQKKAEKQSKNAAAREQKEREKEERLRRRAAARNNDESNSEYGEEEEEDES